MITLREFKIYISGVVTAFIITLAVSLSSINQQQIIANTVEIAVVGMVITLFCTVLFTTLISLVKNVKKEIMK